MNLTVSSLYSVVLHTTHYDSRNAGLPWQARGEDGTFSVGCASSVPGQGTKSPHDLQPENQSINTVIKRKIQ